jgi:hypothetical protein
VISPPAGAGARYSIPFFQGVGLDARFEVMLVPEEIKSWLLRGKKRNDVEFTFTKDAGFDCLGEAILMNRVRVVSLFDLEWLLILILRLKVTVMSVNGGILIYCRRLRRRKRQRIDRQKRLMNTLSAVFKAMVSTETDFEHGNGTRASR